jgi:hypothetical protein
MLHDVFNISLCALDILLLIEGSTRGLRVPVLVLQHDVENGEIILWLEVS